MVGSKRIPLLTTLGAILLSAPTIAGRHRQGGTPVPLEVIQEARALNARYRHLVPHFAIHRRIEEKRQRRLLQQRQQQKKNSNDDDDDDDDARRQSHSKNSNDKQQQQPSSQQGPERIRRRQQQQEQQQQKRGLSSSSESPEILFLEAHLFRKPQKILPDHEQIVHTKKNGNNYKGDTATNGNNDDNNDSSMTTLRQLGLEASAEPLFFCSSCTANEQDECTRCKEMLTAQHATIIQQVQQLFPKAKIVAATMKLTNAVFVEMAVMPDDDLAEMDFALSQIPGVLRVLPSEDSVLEDVNAVLYMGGGAALEQAFCGVGGNGVTIAILDRYADFLNVFVCLSCKESNG